MYKQCYTVSRCYTMLTFNERGNRYSKTDVINAGLKLATSPLCTSRLKVLDYQLRLHALLDRIVCFHTSAIIILYLPFFFPLS